MDVRVHGALQLLDPIQHDVDLVGVASYCALCCTIRKRRPSRETPKRLGFAAG
jgi:hypothetical protein